MDNRTIERQTTERVLVRCHMDVVPCLHADYMVWTILADGFLMYTHHDSIRVRRDCKSRLQLLESWDASVLDHVDDVWLVAGIVVVDVLTVLLDLYRARTWS
jgi:hypothetical protein